jgi:microcystin-dependent protein
MSQYDYGTIDVIETNGTELATMLQQFRDAVESRHSGSSRPPYAQAGMKWLDTSGATWLEKFFDGADDILLGTFDPTTNIYYPNLHYWTAEITIASATTTDVLGLDSNRAIVTGTNTISSFGTRKNTLKFVRFTGALTISNGSSIVTPDGSDISVTAGQTLIVVSDSAGVARIWSAPSSGVPVGQVVQFAMNTAPQGYLKCNGAAISRTAYAGLFAQIGTLYGAGDGSTTFNVPDLRGEFIRGFDDGRGVDAGRTIGSAQAQSIQSHGHTAVDPGHTHSVSDPGHAHSLQGFQVPTRTFGGGGQLDVGNGGQVANIASTSAAGTGIAIAARTTGITIAAAGGVETRGRNVALLYCIKY